MQNIKNRNIKWWLSIVSCMILFVTIGVFTYMKMGFLINGIRITATIEHADTSSLIEVKGVALNAVYLSLNGREIFIDKDGAFTETMALLPGLGVVTLDAQDKFGKTTEKKFEVLYEERGGTVAFNTLNTNIN